MKAKKIVSVFLSFVITVGAMSVCTVNASAAKKYNPDAACNYAREHVYTDRGKCAEFVSNCIKAGGITDAWDVSCSALVKELIKSNSGKLVKLNMTNGYITYSSNKANLSKGDPIFWYCANETDGKPYVHTAIYSGSVSGDKIKVYARNGIKNNEPIRYSQCAYCHSNNITAYAFHFGSSANNETIITQKAGLSTLNLPIFCYTLSSSTTKLGNGREIWGSDLCKITKINSNGTMVVSYPTSSGNRTVTLSSSIFFKGTSVKKVSIKSDTKVYRRASGNATIGSAWKNDDIYMISGSNTNGRCQIAYRLDNNAGWKMGWISTSQIR